jgi:hypothetical protein
LKNKEQLDPRRLSDDECDFIIQRVLWSLRDVTNPIDFFRGMGRAVVFEVHDRDRSKVRDLVRLLAHADASTSNATSEQPDS